MSENASFSANDCRRNIHRFDGCGLPPTLRLSALPHTSNRFALKTGIEFY